MSLHGSAFEFHDDQHLKARNFFLPAAARSRSGSYNNYGGTLGGPIVKNKLFFFFSYDATRQKLALTPHTYSDCRHRTVFQRYLPVQLRRDCTSTAP